MCATCSLPYIIDEGETIDKEKRLTAEDYAQRCIKGTFKVRRDYMQNNKMGILKCVELKLSNLGTSILANGGININSQVSQGCEPAQFRRQR